MTVFTIIFSYQALVQLEIHCNPELHPNLDLTLAGVA